MATFTYELPTFTPIADYDDTGLFECVQRAKSRYSSNLSRVKHVTKRFSWLQQCLPPVHTSILSISAETPSSSKTFRSPGYHVDDTIYGERLSLLTTHHGTIFAGCKLTVDHKKYADLLTEIHNGYEQPAHIHRGLRSLYGWDWFEQLTGENKPVERRDAGTIHNLVHSVEDLHYATLEAGQLAHGPTETTLHSSPTLHQIDDSTRRVFFRTLYTPTT